MAESTWRIGTFRDRDAAESAVRQLREMGYDDSEISVMMADKEKAAELARATGASAMDGAAAGAGIGGGLGAIVAGLTATGTIAATGGAAAPLVVGPLAAALAGLGAGGVAGGIVGALIGVGVPKVQAHKYERELSEGGILIGVQSEQGDGDRLASVLSEETDSGQGVTTIGNGGSSPRRDADVGDEDPQTGERGTFASRSIGGHLSE